VIGVPGVLIYYLINGSKMPPSAPNSYSKFNDKQYEKTCASSSPVANACIITYTAHSSAIKLGIVLHYFQVYWKVHSVLQLLNNVKIVQVENRFSD
jgi:hypothetical protein